MPYFHATTKDRIESIYERGLGGESSQSRNFTISKAGVYLASDPLLAVGFLIERALADEWAHLSPKEALDLFVVVVIDDSRVSQKLLIPDENIEMEGFWRYPGLIDVTAMPFVSATDVAEWYLKKSSAAS